MLDGPGIRETTGHAVIAASNAEVRQGRHLPTETSVQIAVTQAWCLGRMRCDAGGVVFSFPGSSLGTPSRRFRPGLTSTSRAPFPSPHPNRTSSAAQSSPGPPSSIPITFCLFKPSFLSASSAHSAVIPHEPGLLNRQLLPSFNPPNEFVQPRSRRPEFIDRGLCFRLSQGYGDHQNLGFGYVEMVFHIVFIRFDQTYRT